MTRVSWLLSIALLLCSPAASAQPAEGAEEEIVVTAPAPQIVRDFVRELSAPRRGRALARWDRVICPGVAGMRSTYAEAMIDRIARTAIYLGLEVGEEGCEPNIIIFYAFDADRIAAEIFESAGRMSRRVGASRGPTALRDFVETHRPVRWWHMSANVNQQGFVVPPGQNLQVWQMSRIRNNVRRDFQRALIIIDAGRVDGRSLLAVTDYVTMAALAQLDPDAELPNVPSILHLFSDGGETPQEHLTEWDLAYLEGLYGAERCALYASSQEGQIARSMRRSLSTGAPHEAAPEDGAPP